MFHGKDGASLTSAQLYAKLTGAAVSDADAGHVPGATVGETMQASNQDFLMQAKIGVVSMTSSLMTALFGLQEDKA